MSNITPICFSCLCSSFNLHPPLPPPPQHPDYSYLMVRKEGALYFSFVIRYTCQIHSHAISLPELTHSSLVIFLLQSRRVRDGRVAYSVLEGGPPVAHSLKLCSPTLGQVLSNTFVSKCSPPEIETAVWILYLLIW